MKLSTILGKDYEKIVGTLTEEEILCVVDGLKKKNVRNPLTIRFVLDYLYSHKKVYGEVIDTMEVAEKIVKNLDKDISLFSVMKRTHGGEYSQVEGQVRMSFVYTLKSITRRKKKCNLGSVLRHEIDHCVTTDPELRKGKMVCSGIVRESCFDEIIRTFDRRTKNASKWVSSGLYALDEGITVFKQGRYDEVHGVEKPGRSDFYEIYFQVAQHLAKMIGEKNMIQLHFWGDFGKMREDYFDRTGLDLGRIVYFLGEVRCGNIADPQNEDRLMKMIDALEKGKIILKNIKEIENDCAKKDEKE